MGSLLPWACSPLLLCLGAVAGILCCGCPARAQDLASASLPEAPMPQGQAGAAASALEPGSVRGVVVDPDGNWISGAQILLSQSGQSNHTVTSGADGRFLFPAVSAGNFVLSVSAAGFSTRSLPESVVAGERLLVPDVALSLAPISMEVDAVVSPQQLAEEELHVEEKQRIVGVIPNFFVAYDWHAPPLSTKQKFQLVWRNEIDPVNVGINAIYAGVEQAQNDFSGFGPGPAGYFKRFGATTGDFTVGNYLGGAILPALFHQDPRYFQKADGTIKNRAEYAVSRVFVTRGDNGKEQVNYSNLVATFSSGAISNLYYPAENRNGAGLTLENSLLGLASEAAGNLVQQFIWGPLTTHHKDKVSGERP